MPLWDISNIIEFVQCLYLNLSILNPNKKNRENIHFELQWMLSIFKCINQQSQTVPLTWMEAVVVRVSSRASHTNPALSASGHQLEPGQASSGGGPAQSRQPASPPDNWGLAATTRHLNHLSSGEWRDGYQLINTWYFTIDLGNFILFNIDMKREGSNKRSN